MTVFDTKCIKLFASSSRQKHMQVRQEYVKNEESSIENSKNFPLRILTLWVHNFTWHIWHHFKVIFKGNFMVFYLEFYVLKWQSYDRKFDVFTKKMQKAALCACPTTLLVEQKAVADSRREIWPLVLFRFRQTACWNMRFADGMRFAGDIYFAKWNSKILPKFSIVRAF